MYAHYVRLRETRRRGRRTGQDRGTCAKGKCPKLVPVYESRMFEYEMRQNQTGQEQTRPITHKSECPISVRESGKLVMAVELNPGELTSRRSSVAKA